MFGVPKIFRSPDQGRGGVSRSEKSREANDLLERITRRFREEDTGTYMTVDEAMTLLTYVAPDTVLPLIDNEIAEGRLKLNQELEMLITAARTREAA